MTTQIVPPSPEYTLKFDDKENELRDSTYQELVRDFGKNAKVRCPCMDREYIITSQWLKTHIESKKHKCWKSGQNDEHIKKYGHCNSNQLIFEVQKKENRELKINIHKLTSEITKKDNKYNILSEKLTELIDEKDLYSEELENTQKELENTQKELENTQKELENTQKELENTQKESKNTQEELENTQKELENAQEELENAQEELENTQEELENKHDELEKLKKELELYKEQYKSSNEEIITLTKFNDKLKADILKLNKNTFKIPEKPGWKTR